MTSLPGVGAPDGVSLAGLPEAERRRRLVAETARFTSAFLRWMEGRACGGLKLRRLRLPPGTSLRWPAIMRDLGVQLGVSPRNMTAMVDALENAQARGTPSAPHRPPGTTLVELSRPGPGSEQALEPRLTPWPNCSRISPPRSSRRSPTCLVRLGQAIQARQDAC